MNCEDCQEKFILRIEAVLINSELDAMNDHIKNCSSCSDKLIVLEKIYSFIDYEKTLRPNPFISTRIMQQLDNSFTIHKYNRNKWFQPAFFLIMIIIALFSGIFIGNSYNFILTEESSFQQVEESIIYELNKENIELTLLTEDTNE